MKYMVLTLALLTSTSSLATVICPNGYVEKGDSYKTVKKKCDLKGDTQGGMTSFIKNNKEIRFMYSKTELVLKDGSKVNFIFIEDQFVFISNKIN